MGCTQSTPVQEPVAAAPASNASAAPASQSAAVPTSNGSSASKNSSTDAAVASPPSVPAATKLYTVSGVSITEQGIVYYHIEATDGSVSLKKRFNDFKELYAKLTNSSLLPPLPQSNLATLFRSKHNPALIKEREEQFEDILNAIGNNAVFASADAFKAFLA